MEQLIDADDSTRTARTRAVQLLPNGLAAPIHVEVEADRHYYLAAAHRSPVRSITITNLALEPIDDQDELVITCEVESAASTSLLEPKALGVPLPLLGLDLPIRRFQLRPNLRTLALLEERIQADVVVTVRRGDELVGIARAPMEFLAHNQWMFATPYFDSLAAFAQPNSPAIDRIVTRARALLEERTGSGSTQGYQSVDGGEPERVHQMAEAAFDALRELRIAYSDPPPSFEGYGQKIRTADVVLAEQAATCLDSAILYVACLQRMGLVAQVVVIAGHALSSYLTGDPRRPVWETEGLPESVMRDPNVLGQLLADDVIRLVETTDFTAAHDRTFQTARRSGDQRVSDPSSFRALIDVAACVRTGVAPLPARDLVVQAAETTTIDVERSQQTGSGGTGWFGADDPTDASAHRLEQTERPPRVDAWLRSLLDLSYRNPLIRMRAGGRGASAIQIKLPRGVVAAAEDRLMSGGLVIQAGTSAPSALQRDPDDGDAYRDEIRRTGTLFFPSADETQAAERGFAAALAEKFPDEPSGRISTLAAEITQDDCVRTLDRVMRGLKRKAGDLERQTGSNNLFLSVGELRWTGDDNKAGSAPLFLVPVRLTGSAKQGYRIEPDDAAEVMPNHALLEKLRQTYGLTIDALERPITDDAGIDVDKLLAGVRSALSGERIRDAAVVESLTLAVLDFSSFRLWRDLHDHWPLFLQSPVVHHLVHTPSADFIEPEEQLEATAADLPILCPIEADESQLEAITCAVSGRTFVLEGPPGTGKSQTITNLLAASIAAGKKVLFVAEKSAALDVVRKRLVAIGLGPLCLELFDKEAKPDHIKKQIQASLDLQPPDLGAEWDDVVGRLGADERRLDDYRVSVHGVGDTGQSAWTAHQEALRLGDGPTIDLPTGFLQQLPAHEQSIRDALLELPRLVGAPTIVHPHPWSLCNQQDFPQLDTARLAWAVSMLAWSRSILSVQSPALVAAFGEVADPAEFAIAAAAIEQALDGEGLRPDEISVVGLPPWIASRDAALAQLDGFLAAAQPILSVFRMNVLTDDLSSLHAAGDAALTAGALSRGRAVRTFNAAVLSYQIDPTERPTAELMAQLRQVDALKAQWSAAHHAVTSLAGLRLPPTWSALDGASIELARTQLAALPTRAAAGRAPIPQLLLAVPDAAQRAPQLIEALRGASTGWNELLTALRVDGVSAQRWSAGRTFGEAWADVEPAWVSDGERLLLLQRWCDTIAALQPLRAAGLEDFAEQILVGAVPLDDAYTWFRRSVARAVLDGRLIAARLDRFDGHAHERVVEDFTARHAKHRGLMTDRIPGELVERRPVPKGKRIGKWGELERHLAAQRRKLSIRKLIEEYGTQVGDLTPCFLMSPDSVARFIPPGSITFDLVVFDEASQIEVPRAVGALGRARAAVVVGDTKQMPPSRFGGAASADDSESDGTELVVTDLESLLEECRESRLPALTLTCHYRSRHEALIAFSNHHFYEDQLTTFPSPVAADAAPIGWQRVDGRFRRRAAALPEGWDEQADPWPIGTNLIEARAVIDEILERLNDPERSSESIGVVTSNQPQRELIRDLLVAQGDPALAALLERDDGGGLLVQNLENVQGDERDVILMSIGFSPDVKVRDDGTEVRGRLPMNFGPLNQKGGERRLNVAVTRARSEMVIFCSFEPEEMSVGPESPRGIQLLHAYLAAARDGVTRSGDVVGRVPQPADRHRVEVAAALRERGFRVQEDIGLSRFRVDIAVGLADEDGYQVAVLLDGPNWAERSHVYDRDVLPQSVLSGLMGWPEVVRVWLPMWLHAREDVLKDIEAAMDRCVAASEAAALLRESLMPPPAPPPIPDGMAVPLATVSLPDPALPGLPAPPALTTLETTVPPPLASAPSVAPQADPASPPVSPIVEDEHDVFGPDVPVFGAGVVMTELGGKDVLDGLPSPISRQRVHAAIVELVNGLGPVEQEELCKLVARRFGLSRVRADRVEAIRSLIPQLWIQRSVNGTFVWPDSVDPTTWTGFRRNSPDSARRLPETPPEEIRNAMVECVRQGVEVSQTELFELVAKLFGNERQTAPIKARLEAVVDEAIAGGRLARSADGWFNLP